MYPGPPCRWLTNKIITNMKPNTPVKYRWRPGRRFFAELDLDMMKVCLAAASSSLVAS